MRFIVVITILTLLNSYVLSKFTSFFGISLPAKTFIILSLVSFQSLGLLKLQKTLLKIEKFLRINNLSTFIYRTSYLILGIIQCLFVYNILADIIRLILYALLPSNSPIYLEFCRVPITIIITSITVSIGIISIARGPIVEKVEIILDKLPKNFDGFTIVQISDLHVGPTIKRPYVEKVVKITNALKADLVALTGDFVDGDVEYLKDDVVPLANLCSSYGTFFVAGNHEYYAGVDQWLEEFERLGFVNLINQHVLISKNEEQLVLAGVTDYSTIRRKLKDPSSPTKAVIAAPTGLVKILLAHHPASYLQAKNAGFDLQLSGHTHGGQYFPFTFLIRFFHRYYRGLNNHEGMWIYVNRGTGYWGPPLRVGSPAEITLITLKSKNYQVKV